MGSPQTEDGYTRVANELLEALIRVRIPGEARQMLDLIIRKTYGFNKKSDRIATSQFMEATGLTRKAIEKGRKKLREMNIIIAPEKGGSYCITYSINKHYKTWVIPPKKGATPQNGLRVPPKKEAKYPPKGETQKTKDNITKDIKNPALPDLSKQICLKSITHPELTEPGKHKIFNQLIDAFRQRGWRDEPEYVKGVFERIVKDLNGHKPKEFFPYFRKVATNHINENAELYAADARIKRDRDGKKVGITVMGVTV